MQDGSDSIRCCQILITRIKKGVNTSETYNREVNTLTFKLVSIRSICLKMSNQIHILEYKVYLCIYRCKLVSHTNRLIYMTCEVNESYSTFIRRYRPD